MTGSTCKCGEGHDKDTCSDCGFQFVTKYGGKDKKHHHSTAGTYETTNQTNYSAAEDGLDNAGFFIHCHHFFLGGHNWFHDEFDTEKHGHKCGKASHSISGNKSGKEAGNECKEHNGEHHYQTIFNIQVFILSIFIGRNCTGQYITGKRNSDCLIRVHSEKRDQHRADYRSCTHSGEACAKSCTKSGKNTDNDSCNHNNSPFLLWVIARIFSLNFCMICV